MSRNVLGNTVLASLDEVKKLNFDTGKELSKLADAINNDLQGKQDWLQFDKMPSPAFYTGKIVQYVGEAGSYKKGYFYISTGTSWAEFSVSSAVAVVDALPRWKHANNGVIYYVKPENKLYVKKDMPGEWYSLTGNTFIIVDELPAIEDAAHNTIYITLKGKTAAGYIKSKDNNEWYQLGGGSASSFEILSALPSWTDAEENKLYLIPGSESITGYVKDPNTLNKFWQLGETPAPFEITSSLPSWFSAEPKKIYFMKGNEEGELRGYVKNESVTNKWYVFGQPKLKVKRYPDSEYEYDPEALLPEEEEELDLSGLILEAYNDAEIEKLYKEVEAWT